MNLLKRILVACICIMYIYGPQIELAAQTVPGNEIRLTARADPGPLTGRYRVWIGLTDGLLHCIKPDGTNCISSTTSIAIGTTTTGAAGTSASVTNSGTSSAPILNFTIPQGLPGASGPAGPGFTFRGAWTATTAYNALDIVTNAGSTYEADHGFTSGATFDPANWNLWAAAGAQGPAGTGSGTVTSFGVGSWPSWLTPTVTNGTTTPSLAVSGAAIAAHTFIGNNTGASAASAAVAITTADVPTLNQNTTGKSTGTYASMSFGPFAGNISQTSGTIIANTIAPVGITVANYTMHILTAPAGCTTLPTYQLYDVTSATALSTLTLVNGTTDYSNTGLSVAVTSGHTVAIRVGVTSAGCTTQPGTGSWAFWYTNS